MLAGIGGGDARALSAGETGGERRGGVEGTIVSLDRGAMVVEIKSMLFFTMRSNSRQRISLLAVRSGIDRTRNVAVPLRDHRCG
jgi:hypothetical protein